MKKSILIIGLLLAAILGRAQDVCGSWSGILKLQEREIGIVFNIVKNGENYVTTMDSPTQKVKGFSTTSTSYSNNILSIRMDDSGMSYEGRYMADGFVHGVFTQMGKRYSLVLSKMQLKSITSAPVEVAKNFHAYSYYVDSVAINADVKAVITTPIKKGKTKAIIIECEQGYTAFENNFSHEKNVREIVDHLTGNGFLVVHFSEKKCDTNAAIAYLKSTSLVNEKSITVLKLSDNEMCASLFGSSRKFCFENKQTVLNPKIKSINLLTSWLLRNA